MQSHDHATNVRAIRPGEAKKLYGIGRSKLYKLMAEGKVRSVSLGKMRLVSVDSLESLIRGEAA